MKLPTSEPRTFILELRQSLMGSMALRERDCATWDYLFYTGANSGEAAAIANMVPSRIKSMAGNTFSPDRLTFRLEYDQTADDPAIQRGTKTASWLSRELRDAEADLEFGDGVELAYRHGSALGSVNWNGNAFEVTTIPMAAVGVANEYSNSLYIKQPAFMVSYTIPVEEFRRDILKFRGTADVASAFDGKGDNAMEMGEGTRVVLGLNNPIGYNPFSSAFSPAFGGSSAQAGYVSLLPRAPYVPTAGMRMRQVQVDAIWMQKDDGKWATALVIEGSETIGTDQWRNFLAMAPDGHEDPDLAHRHPYFYICPTPVKGSFFGRSAIADFAEGQGFIRRRADDYDRILAKIANPTYVGFGAAITPDIWNQARRDGVNFIQETGPASKIQPFAPEAAAVPQLVTALELGGEWLSEAANSPPVVQGRGERGVRAGAHAETLLTAASVRERRPALRAVRQCGDMGDVALAIARVKCAELIDGGLAHSLEDGFHVYCNGYTASPMFAIEYRQMLDDLLKAGAIGPEEYLELRNPEGEDMLKSALHRRQEREEKVVESLPPEDRAKVLTSVAGGKRR